jgi:hypothetical protein
MAVVDIIRPILQEQQDEDNSRKRSKLVVTGDFNSLSPLDSSRYDEENLVDFFRRTDNPVFLRMVSNSQLYQSVILTSHNSSFIQRKKYCKYNDSSAFQVVRR